MIYHDIPWCTNQWADAVKMLKGTVFSMTSDQLYHTGEKRSCDVACTACILLSLEVWLSVLITFMFYICFIYALYVLSCFITSEFQGSHSQTFRVSYLPGVFQARLTGKSVGSPAFESPLNGGDPTQAPLKAIRPVCGGKVGCWVLLSQTSPKWSQLLSSWGRFSYESYRSTYIWTRCHRN